MPTYSLILFCLQPSSVCSLLLQQVAVQNYPCYDLSLKFALKIQNGGKLVLNVVNTSPDSSQHTTLIHFCCQYILWMVFIILTGLTS